MLTFPDGSTIVFVTPRPGGRGRHRRARRRWFIQLGRKLRRHGVCPCGDERIPPRHVGTHLPTCLWADEDYDGPCWCGEENPAYLTEGLDASCGGSGMLWCHCGGDLCVCHHHGEVECPGCDDCNDGDGAYEGDDWTDDDGDTWTEEEPRC